MSAVHETSSESEQNLEDALTTPYKDPAGSTGILLRNGVFVLQWNRNCRHYCKFLKIPN